MRGRIFYLLDASGVTGGKVTCHLEIARIEDGKDRVVKEVEDGENTGCHNGSLLDHPEGNKWYLGKASIPEQEDKEDNHSNDKHGYEGALVPATAVLRSSKRKGDESKTQSDDQQRSSHYIEVDPEAPGKSLDERLRLVG